MIHKCKCPNCKRTVDTTDDYAEYGLCILCSENGCEPEVEDEAEEEE